MIDGDISTMETEEMEQIEDNNRKFLYARVVHANHMIQHHMHEILEHHIKHTVYTGNRLKIPVEELELGADDDASTLATQETLVKI